MRQITFIELQTLISEIEIILNNRPLCADYDNDIDDVLTPNHLVFGRRLETSNNLEIVQEGEDQDLSRRMRHLNGLLKFFWNIWKKEYLVALRETHKSTDNKSANINIDDIVIIHNEYKPRQLWKLARVVELLKGIDGIVRAVKLRTGRSSCIITRPINKLYPLETSSQPVNEVSMDRDISRPRRKAAVVAEVRRKFLDEGDH